MKTKPIELQKSTSSFHLRNLLIPDNMPFKYNETAGNTAFRHQQALPSLHLFPLELSKKIRLVEAGQNLHTLKVQQGLEG